jgi:hypothetical protein
MRPRTFDPEHACRSENTKYKQKDMVIRLLTYYYCYTIDSLPFFGSFQNIGQMIKQGLLKVVAFAVAVDRSEHLKI